jgi:malate/lactate dehydrogenase
MTINTAPTKLSVIGAGAVGSSLAYAALIRGSAQRIALYDINDKKADAEVRDLNHGTQFTPSSGVEGGGNIEVAQPSGPARPGSSWPRSTPTS